MAGTEALLLTLLMVAALLLMAGQLHRLPLLMPEDNNEGWNAYHALAAMSGSLSYPSTTSFITNNYPPLSFYVVGTVGKLVGDNVLAGRLIALLSELLVALNVFLLLREFGARAFVAGFTAVLFLFHIGLTASSYVAMDDPQWLGHALATSGAVLFMRSRRGASQLTQPLLSSLLCVSAVFVKHNLIILPLTLSIWALLYERRRLLMWLALGLTVGGLTLALTLNEFGFAFLRDVLAHKRPLLPVKLVEDLARFGEPLAPLLLCTALLARMAWNDRNDRYARLLVLYGALAAASGVFFLAGEGIDVNVLFDLDIALVMSSGLLISRLTENGTVSMRGISAGGAAALLVVAYLPALPAALAGVRDSLRQDRVEPGEYRDLILDIAKNPGPAACEQLVLCYWAGKPFEIDLSNYGKKLHLGAVDPQVLGRRFDEGYYREFQVQAWPVDGQTALGRLLGPELSRRLVARYRGSRIFDEEWLLAPRR